VGEADRVRIDKFGPVDPLVPVLQLLLEGFLPRAQALRGSPGAGLGGARSGNSWAPPELWIRRGRDSPADPRR
jgi:hypothetical protein